MIYGATGLLYIGFLVQRKLNSLVKFCFKVDAVYEYVRFQSNLCLSGHVKEVGFYGDVSYLKNEVAKILLPPFNQSISFIMRVSSSWPMGQM